MSRPNLMLVADRRELLVMHRSCADATPTSTYWALAVVTDPVADLLSDRCPWCQFRLDERPDPHLEVRQAGSAVTPPARTDQAQRVVIPGWVPEALANGSHGHWSVRQRKLRMAQEMVWLHTHNAGWRPIPGRVRLTVVLVFPAQRRRDTDNLYSRVKGLVDGLVKSVLIDDDNTDVLELVVRAEVRPGIRQTELTLEPLEAA